MSKFFEHLHNIIDVNCGNDVLQALQSTGLDILCITGNVELKKKGSKLSVLKNLVENGASLEYRVGTVVLLVIGSIIAPDTLVVMLKPFIALLHVHNINEIRNFAWGEAILVSLHHGLRLFKQKKRSSVTGSTLFFYCFNFFFLSFLQLFALQYTRPLLDFIGVSTRPPLNFPLIVDWCREMTRPCKNDYITWQSYQNLPQSVGQQMNKILAIKSMLWINICIYHQPHLALRQLRLSNETQEGPQIEARNRINEQNLLVGEEDDLVAEANEAGVEEDPHLVSDVDEADLFYDCNDEMIHNPVTNMVEADMVHDDVISID
ncbi:hypothetical protein NE237_016759 [Protea cynaroides]|uniref:Aminotransferase-like plant mobile domain-containing protein n=1 Tax=Protea cynaroides TaxID=273540 RepID=A0A9Q0K6X9_9MAGN|nr:hypothetical protein NE237_016759 [Protea cynaroides]